MTDDIVTRLREMWGDDDRCIWCKKHMDSQSIPHREVCDLMEAADEIEHLREAHEYLRTALAEIARLGSIGAIIPHEKIEL